MGVEPKRARGLVLLVKRHVRAERRSCSMEGASFIKKREWERKEGGSGLCLMWDKRGFVRLCWDTEIFLGNTLLRFGKNALFLRPHLPVKSSENIKAWIFLKREPKSLYYRRMEGQEGKPGRTAASGLDGLDFCCFPAVDSHLAVLGSPILIRLLANSSISYQIGIRASFLGPSAAEILKFQR
ncbi:hypothetical protein MA16_Dca023166 [Dendrobium catenatum]|uniref:Uncharacterized protein n=1 Tax=Dendrobium catenatum TaxID=906689 RepID=A0A2I0VUE3_9ASPA|nr:hypothetical protein MA16_Dca023166 [Dendrobium catenatum]